jgi:hypothetical protein
VKHGHDAQADGHQGGRGAEGQTPAAKGASQPLADGGEGAPRLAGSHFRAHRYPAAVAGGGSGMYLPQLPQLLHEGEQVFVRDGVERRRRARREDLLLGAGAAGEYVAESAHGYHRSYCRWGGKVTTKRACRRPRTGATRGV